MQHREATIRHRAYALWVESGHVHGRDEQHWQQAEREVAEAEAQPAVTEQATVPKGVPAKPAGKKAAKAVVPSAAEAAPIPTRKGRATR